MITLYYRDHSTIRAVELMASDSIPQSTVWIDMYVASPEEIDRMEQHLNIQIPTGREVWKNHVLNRLYVEGDVAYMTAALITKVESPYPGTSPVAFVLTHEYLLTVRDIDPTSFRNFAKRTQRANEFFPNAWFLLEGLLEEVITRVAHNSEIVVDALDDLSHQIFEAKILGTSTSNASQAMKNVLRLLGSSADLNSKINESLHSLQRLLLFFREIVCNDPVLDRKIDILLSDASALTTQTGFVSDKVTFQLDATLGMINVEQNLIIKLFSVVAVFLMPPTLISGIYGMNFAHMPELNWIYGYPLALGLMVVCAAVPFFYFKKKGWL